MNILLTNDDGIMAPGINILAEELSKEHEVLVVAPDVERSATGHAITIRTPLWAKEVRVGNKEIGYAINGTPADCVKLGLLAISSILFAASTRVSCFTLFSMFLSPLLDLTPVFSSL